MRRWTSDGRLERHCGGVLLDGFSRFPGEHQGHAQVEVRDGIVRRQFQGAAQERRRLLVVSAARAELSLAPDAAELEIARAIGGGLLLQPLEFLELLFALVCLPEAHQGRAQRVVRLRLRRIQRQRAVRGVHGVVGTAPCRRIELREAGVRGRTVGVDRQRHRELGERLVRAAEPRVRVAEILVRRAVVRLGVHAFAVGVDRHVEVLARGGDGAHRLVDAVQSDERVEGQARLKRLERFDLLALALLQPRQRVMGASRRGNPGNRFAQGLLGRVGAPRRARVRRPARGARARRPG